MSAKFQVVEHPVLQTMLGRIRNKTTDTAEFRRCINIMAKFLAYEATRDLSTTTQEIETPLEKTQISVPKKPPMIISIMRAGNGMLEGVMDILPFCRAGHIGLYREDGGKKIVEYYFKIPSDHEGRDVLLVDPMLATGNSAVACIERIKKQKVGKIKMLNILVCQEGIDNVHQHHPDVEIYAAGKDPILNEKAYIVPGLGDAGDRIYGTF